MLLLIDVLLRFDDFLLANDSCVGERSESKVANREVVFVYKAMGRLCVTMCKPSFSSTIE